MVSGTFSLLLILFLSLSSRLGGAGDILLTFRKCQLELCVCECVRVYVYSCLWGYYRVCACARVCVSVVILHGSVHKSDYHKNMAENTLLIVLWVFLSSFLLSFFFPAEQWYYTFVLYINCYQIWFIVACLAIKEYQMFFIMWNIPNKMYSKNIPDQWFSYYSLVWCLVSFLIDIIVPYCFLVCWGLELKLVEDTEQLFNFIVKDTICTNKCTLPKPHIVHY